MSESREGYTIRPLPDNFAGWCEVCMAELHGGFEVTNGDLPDGSFFVSVEGTSDRDFIVCDGLCSRLLCRACAPHWPCGYCDDCLDALDLWGRFGCPERPGGVS